MSTMASQITGASIVQVQIKENVIAPRHWPSWRESTGHKGPNTRKMFTFDDLIMYTGPWNNADLLLTSFGESERSGTRVTNAKSF